MSELAYGGSGFDITTYVGSARDDGASRKMVQIANLRERMYVSLTLAQWAELREAAIALGPCCLQVDPDGAT